MATGRERTRSWQDPPAGPTWFPGFPLCLVHLRGSQGISRPLGFGGGIPGQMRARPPAVAVPSPPGLHPPHKCRISKWRRTCEVSSARACEPALLGADGQGRELEAQMVPGQRCSSSQGGGGVHDLTAVTDGQSASPQHRLWAATPASSQGNKPQLSTPTLGRRLVLADRDRPPPPTPGTKRPARGQGGAELSPPSPGLPRSLGSASGRFPPGGPQSLCSQAHGRGSLRAGAEDREPGKRGPSETATVQEGAPRTAPVHRRRTEVTATPMPPQAAHKPTRRLVTHPIRTRQFLARLPCRPGSRRAATAPALGTRGPRDPTFVTNTVHRRRDARPGKRASKHPRFTLRSRMRLTPGGALCFSAAPGTISTISPAGRRAAGGRAEASSDCTLYPKGLRAVLWNFPSLTV